MYSDRSLAYGLYLEARSIAANSDIAYRAMLSAIATFRPDQLSLLAKRDSEVVIEGFPRSANTFFTAHFLTSQPRSMRVAHHLHEAYQIRLAERFAIPCVVLIRPPADAVVSSLLRDRRPPPSSLIRNYIRFYSESLRVRVSWVPAPFAAVIAEPNAIIAKLNSAYGTSFSKLDASEIELVTNRVVEMDRRALAADASNPLRIALPSPEKDAAKSELMRVLRRDHGELLRHAEGLHDRIVDLV